MHPIDHLLLEASDRISCLAYVTDDVKTLLFGDVLGYLHRTLFNLFYYLHY